MTKLAKRARERSRFTSFRSMVVSFFVKFIYWTSKNKRYIYNLKVQYTISITIYYYYFEVGSSLLGITCVNVWALVLKNCSNVLSETIVLFTKFMVVSYATLKFIYDIASWIQALIARLEGRLGSDLNLNLTLFGWFKRLK